MQPFESFRTKRPARIRRGGRRSSSSSPILINYHGPFTLSCPAFCVFFGLWAPVLKLYDRIAPRIGIAQRPPRPGFVYRHLRPLGGRAAKPGAHPRWFFHSHTHARYPGTHLRARVVTRVPKSPKNSIFALGQVFRPGISEDEWHVPPAVGRGGYKCPAPPAAAHTHMERHGKVSLGPFGA